MNLFKRSAAAVAGGGPKHVEIWGQLEQQNRFLRRVAGVSIAWAFIALALGAYGLLVGLYRPVAFHVSPEGEASFVGRLREQVGPSEAEVRHVSKSFLNRYVAFNSLTVESDMAEAWNLMTDELRAEHARMLADYEKQRGVEFVAWVKAQGIQTVLEFRNDRTEISEHNGKTFTVRLLGVARTWPLNRVGDEAAFQERDFESFVTLVRCDRTEATPNGLLVAKVATKFYESDDAPNEGAR